MPDAPKADAPSVWLVLGDKQGDNAQVEAIDRALGWPSERRDLVLKPEWVVAKPRVRPTLDHLDLAASDPLEPPWPDLVLTSGRRPSMAALWIQQQSGGRTKLLLVGKPSGWGDRFDLIVVSGETQMAPLANVLKISLPLLRVDESAVAREAEGWKSRLGALPRPLIAFLVGGPTGPFVFDDTVGERLLAQARAVADEGGTPFFTTSRRTPDATVEALDAGMPRGGTLFRWAPDAPENPYKALLGLADGFVVTGDSISMLVEVVRLRRPLRIVDLPRGPLGRMDQIRRSLATWLFAPDPTPLRRLLAGAAHRSGLLTQTRDFRALHRRMIESGLALAEDAPFEPPRGRVPDDLGDVVARIEALFADDRGRR